MSTKFSREDLKKSFQGKSISTPLREKVSDHFNDSFSSAEFKKKMYSELARKDIYTRKKMYRKMGLNRTEIRKMEGYMPKVGDKIKKINSVSSVKKTGSSFFGLFPKKREVSKTVLTDKQKRRNIFESRHSSEDVNDEVGSVAGTGYQRSNIGFGGGDVEVSHRVSSLKTSEQISGKGFARKIDDPHKSNRANAGFSRDISKGMEGGRRPSSDSYPRRPIGF
ncbi:hypothetical protein K8R62_01125 [bacterium]|nr:hypothetical protein [bacterium]